LNDEANLSVLDRGFAQAVAAQFERDRALSKPITRPEWERRPWSEKLLENALALFRSQI
jgi:phosphatidylserine/phosphatidylglycerophosphate/cardiolipin synthase-like enzyme